MQTTGVIYELVFPNGKLYIGKTNNWKRRMRDHSRSSKKKDGHAVKRALAKYGWSNVQRRRLEENVSLLQLGEREAFWIAEKKSLVSQNGYNITKGDDEQPMDDPLVKKWHQKQIKEAMNRPDVRAKKRALWQDSDHKAMMEAARLCFEAAEKRRESFARKRRAKIENMSVIEGKRLMYKVRDRIAKNSRTRKTTTAGQQADALAFWRREWDDYSNTFWSAPPPASLISPPSGACAEQDEDRSWMIPSDYEDDE